MTTGRMITISVRMTPEQIAELELQAKRAGMKPRSYLRYIGEHFPDLDSAFWSLVLARAQGVDVGSVLDHLLHESQRLNGRYGNGGVTNGRGRVTHG